MKSRITVWAALMGVALSGWAAAVERTWQPVRPVPQWVVESLSLGVEATAERTLLHYEATVPDPCHRLSATVAAGGAAGEIVVDLGLEVQVGMSCILVLQSVAGSFDLGTLPPGDQAVVTRVNGKVHGRLPVSVPGAAATPSAIELALESGRPYITRIELDRAEVVVHVEVPASVRKVTLESRARLGAGTWVPRAVERTTGAGMLVFRLAKSEQLEVLRVRGDATEPLPASFYEGQSTFNGPVSTQQPVGDAILWGAPEAAVNDRAGAGGESNREVVESDIWKISGERLYFFNQYRGLQVIDLADPTAPVVLGTLEIPAAGEQMYVLDDAYAVLLARDGCGWYGTEGSQALIVDVRGNQPSLVKAFPIPGYIQESRMVGDALYVASQVYQRITVPLLPGDPRGETRTQWEYGSLISSFNLSQPAEPEAKDTLWYSGYGNVIYATDRYLFVGTQNPNQYWRTGIRIVDISAPDGAMTALGSLAPAGRVADKFKMNMARMPVGGEEMDVFTVISEYWSWNNQRVSVLETFSLVDPRLPARLGRLEVGHGESLFATRFDGDRVYIVTFLRIDPLWVVDLSDPRSPKISGELEIPGWSTYIHPMGDRLVTVGIDNVDGWRVAVSLFDVADPAKPALLDKVPLGENHSWSEANSDEKALTVLEAAGLILVPYQSWGTAGYASRVQLIDLGPDTLDPRGVIDHKMQPRRATVYPAGDQELILSISGRELLSVDATDRDAPSVTAAIELSWPVDRVLLAGDYLIEISDAASWRGDDQPVIRVVRPAAAADAAPVARVALARALPVIGAAVRDGRLYVLQGKAESDWLPVPVKEGEEQPPTPPPTPNLFLLTFELGGLPEELGAPLETEVITDPLGWGPQFEALWPRAGLLVWSGTTSGGYWWRWGMLDVAVAPGRVADGLWWPWWGGNQGGRLIAFDASGAEAPALVSDTRLADANQWWAFSKAYTASGQVYLSHQASEFLEGVTLPGQTKPATTTVTHPDGTVELIEPPIGIWVTRHYLRVVDYADPAQPTLRVPVQIPGELRGLSHAGALLYTVGYHYDPTGKTDGAQYLEASAYDGVEAALVAALKLPNQYPNHALLYGPTIYLARPEAAEGGTTAGLLEAYALDLDPGNKAFRLVHRRTLRQPAQNAAVVGDLLVLQYDRTVEAYAAGTPDAPSALGSGAPQGCLWPNLQNGDGAAAVGLWLPLNDYGVLAVPTR
ncbi:MAG: hypothetical protein FJ387_10195 [Verrucomicrobia bacterium]|nr:hypothetical protein [Verrucomicrobiota bacterium]